MSTEIAIRSTGSLAIAADQTWWTDEQTLVLRQSGIDDDVTEAELRGFLHICQRTGLDPFTRQIYLIGRFDKKAGRKVFTPQTAIDGYRVVRDRVIERTHGSLSYDDALWCGPDGQWRDVWVDDETPPVAAKITVFRDGGRYSAIAKYSEYVQKNSYGVTSMWAKMPAGQLAKCGEALALRKAFPHDLAGVYTAEEMAQADNPPAEQRAQPQITRPAEDDPWQTRPPVQQPPAAARATTAEPAEYAEVVGEPAPAVPAPMARPEQINSIVGGLTAVRGIKDRDAARTAISYIVGRQIGSAKDLTAVEADQVLAVLRTEDQQKQQAAPAAAAPIGTPNNPTVSDAQQKMLNSLLNKAGFGRRDQALEMVSRILRRTVDTREGLSKADASAIINALNKLLDNGEMPPSWEPPAAEQASPIAPSDEGIAEFDALLQMIDDTRPGDESGFNETQRAIEDEFQRGRISQAQVETLRARLADQTTAVAA